MAKPGSVRPVIALRLSEALGEALDARAASAGLVRSSGEPNRSAMIRRMVQYALAHMPPDWAPGGAPRDFTEGAPMPADLYRVTDRDRTGWARGEHGSWTPYRHGEPCGPASSWDALLRRHGPLREVPE